MPVPDSASIAILGIVSKVPCISGKELAERTGIPERTLWRRLGVLERRGLLSNPMGPRHRPEWKVTRTGHAALTTIPRAKPQVIDAVGATLAVDGIGTAGGRIKNFCPPKVGYTDNGRTPLEVQNRRILADKDKVILDLRELDCANRVRIARAEADAAGERRARLRAKAERDAAAAENERLRKAAAVALVPSAPMAEVTAAVPGRGKRAPGQTEDERVNADLRARVSELERRDLRRSAEIDGLRAELAQLRGTAGEPPGSWSFEDMLREQPIPPRHGDAQSS